MRLILAALQDCDIAAGGNGNLMESVMTRFWVIADDDKAAERIGENVPDGAGQHSLMPKSRNCVIKGFCPPS